MWEGIERRGNVVSGRHVKQTHGARFVIPSPCAHDSRRLALNPQSGGRSHHAGGEDGADEPGRA